MKLLTIEQTVEVMLAAARRGDPDATLSRAALVQGILPLMERRGEAQKVGHPRRGMWVVDGNAMWRWQDYVAKRAALVRLGEPGWHEKRAWSEEDLYDLVDAGLYDGEVNHPLFVENGDG